MFTSFHGDRRQQSPLLVKMFSFTTVLGLCAVFAFSMAAYPNMPQSLEFDIYSTKQMVSLLERTGHLDSLICSYRWHFQSILVYRTPGQVFSLQKQHSCRFSHSSLLTVLIFLIVIMTLHGKFNFLKLFVPCSIGLPLQVKKKKYL